MKRKNYNKYMGFLGFFGLLGLQYFTNHNTSTLSYFAFFGFFSYFWINKISTDIPDERYKENSKKAKAFAFNIAIIEFIVLYLIAPLNSISKEILTVISALFFATLLITYAITFYRFEKM